MTNEKHILTFDHVTLSGDGYDGSQCDVSFSVAAGELVFIRAERRLIHLPLFDAAQGLCEPREGTILYDGMDWREMPVFRQSASRGGMGRIYARYDAWLSNLDMDENVTLRERHHSNRPADEVYEEAHALAREFGLEGVPSARPPEVSREVLQACQCVRAFLGRPRLVLAEYPCQFMNDAIREGLLRLIDQRRRDGLAVIWLTLHEGLWETMKKKARCYCAEGDRLVEAET